MLTQTPRRELRVSGFSYAESPKQLEEAAEGIVWMTFIFRRNQVQGRAVDVEAAKQKEI